MVTPREKIGGLGNLIFKEAYILSQVWKGWIPDQYVQSESYWSEYKDRIKAHFSENIRHLGKVSIHVRRGDYVKNPFYIQLWETDFYARAMQMFPDDQFLVFSDDIAWCKEQDIFKNCEFSENHTEVEDLNLMASCKHNIIANSSFSWWAAYLNPHTEKKIIAPKNWFTDGVMRIGLPDEWIQI